MAISNIIEVSSKTTWTSGVASISYIRDFNPVVMDEPVFLGGQDTGANPLEYVTAALNGCKAVMIPLIAKELQFNFKSLDFETKGTVDLRGLMGEQGISSHFQTLVFKVFIETDESDERLTELKTKVASRCPVYNLLKEAGVNIEAIWQRKSLSITNNNE